MILHSYPTSSHLEFKQKHLIIVINSVHSVHFVNTKYIVILNATTWFLAKVGSCVLGFLGTSLM